MPDYDFNYHSGSGDTFIGARPADGVGPPITRAFVAAPQALRKIKMTFTFASRRDDANRLSSPGVGRNLSVNVRRNQAGVAHFDAARTTRNAILASLGIPFTADEGMGYGNEGTVHHAGGTMRMSGNATGVVDTDLKFEAYDNLYCADPSVWPFIPAANPSLTLVALSLRLADHLKAQIT